MRSVNAFASVIPCACQRLDNAAGRSYRNETVRSYYDILGVAECALPEEIKHAYRRLVRRHHPDLAGSCDTTSFREVREAYETLSDEQRRREYDRRLAARRQRRVFRQPQAVPDWFSDESAVDFPSIVTMLDRIRRGLDDWTEKPGSLSAEVQLSAAEARRGISVPLDVPVRCTCPFCGGRGERWMDPCEMCAGYGSAALTQRVDFPVPPGVASGARFRFTVLDDLARPIIVNLRVVVVP